MTRLETMENKKTRESETVPYGYATSTIRRTSNSIRRYQQSLTWPKAWGLERGMDKTTSCTRLTYTCAVGPVRHILREGYHVTRMSQFNRVTRRWHKICVEVYQKLSPREALPAPKWSNLDYWQLVTLIDRLSSLLKLSLSLAQIIKVQFLWCKAQR